MQIMMTASSFPADDADWRSVFIRGLANSLARREDLDLTLWAPPGKAGPRVSHDLDGDDEAWLTELMANGGIANLLRTQPLKGIHTAASLLSRLHAAYLRNAQADLYHVNWLQNALALPSNNKPLLATVLGTDLSLLRFPPVRIALKRLLRQRRAIICPNAGWMVKPLRSSLGPNVEIHEVPFGIDSHWYQIRRAPPKSPPHQWLAVTRLTKGKLGTLFDWAEPYFSNGHRELHLIGPMQQQLRIPPWVHYHGPATPKQLYTRWFPQATGIITLSQHAEGRPQVLLEAMAAGLPIIASSIEAHTSFLKHKSTAWICDQPEEVKDGLEWLEDEATNYAAGHAARSWVRESIGTWDDCAGRYYALYNSLLG